MTFSPIVASTRSMRHQQPIKTFKRYFDRLKERVSPQWSQNFGQNSSLRMGTQASRVPPKTQRSVSLMYSKDTKKLLQNRHPWRFFSRSKFDSRVKRRESGGIRRYASSRLPYYIPTTGNSRYGTSTRSYATLHSAHTPSERVRELRQRF